jgi:hypothetical protein
MAVKSFIVQAPAFPVVKNGNKKAFKVSVKAGNPNSKGRTSTADLLVMASSDQLH